jgi:hypothetical protein
MKGVIMDVERFDSLTRSLGTRRNRRGVVKSFGAAALGAAGLIGLQKTVGAAPSNKVNICHLDEYGAYRYISVSSNAIPAHTAHGDAIDPDFATDVDHCGGCGIVCGAPPNASATCSENVCGFTCNAGYKPDGIGGCIASLSDCEEVFLSGGPDGMTQILVDDDLEVYVNGTMIYTDNDELYNATDPISLGPINDGITVRVVASNSSDYCTAGSQELSPALYLYCPSTGAYQLLDPDGHPREAAGDCGFAFYDVTFVVGS